MYYHASRCPPPAVTGLSLSDAKKVLCQLAGVSRVHLAAPTQAHRIAGVHPSYHPRSDLSRQCTSHRSLPSHSRRGGMFNCCPRFETPDKQKQGLNNGCGKSNVRELMSPPTVITQDRKLSMRQCPTDWVSWYTATSLILHGHFQPTLVRVTCMCWQAYSVQRLRLTAFSIVTSEEI